MSSSNPAEVILMPADDVQDDYGTQRQAHDRPALSAAFAMQARAGRWAQHAFLAGELLHRHATLRSAGLR